MTGSQPRQVGSLRQLRIHRAFWLIVLGICTWRILESTDGDLRVAYASGIGIALIALFVFTHEVKHRTGGWL
jgi:hypothetical protein